MKRPLLRLLIILCAGLAPAQAHDLWIDLDAWGIAKTKADISGEFLVGHVADQTAWTVKADRVVSFVSVDPDGERRDQRDNLVFKAAGQVAIDALALDGRGLHVVAFESTNAFNELPADKFNAYLEEEGLTAVVEARRAAGAGGERGREAYSRRAKALVRLGSGAGPAPKALGHTLEIVPLANPFALKPGAPLRVRVDYKDAPLPGASVSLESLSVGILPKVRRLTDAAGVVSFDLPRSGAWKLNVVWSEPLAKPDPKIPDADYQTVFASLTFGY